MFYIYDLLQELPPAAAPPAGLVRSPLVGHQMPRGPMGLALRSAMMNQTAISPPVVTPVGGGTLPLMGVG